MNERKELIAMVKTPVGYVEIMHEGERFKICHYNGAGHVKSELMKTYEESIKHVVKTYFEN